MRITASLVAVLVACLGAGLGLGPRPGAAEDWKRLSGEEITLALASRVLGYPDGVLQDFLSDGRTLYGESTGRWEVRGDRYCSLWPPSDRWTCYLVDQSGLDIRFTGEDGTTTTGRYVDLN